LSASSTTPTELTSFDEAVLSDGVVALVAEGCVDFDPILSRVEAVCSVTGTGSTGGVLRTDGSITAPETSGDLVSVGGFNAPTPSVTVCLPILMLFALMLTPGASSMLDVEPDVFMVSVVVDAGVLVVDEEPVPVLDVSVDVPTPAPVPVVVPVPVPDEPSLASVPPGDVEPGVVESAVATPGVVATISPIPNAAAIAPTRPIWRPKLLTVESCVFIVAPRLIVVVRSTEWSILAERKVRTCRP
jgi:hypothetical protein